MKSSIYTLNIRARLTVPVVMCRDKVEFAGQLALSLLGNATTGQQILSEPDDGVTLIGG